MKYKKQIVSYLISGGITSGFSPFLSKLIVSAATVTGNYILCKYSIFRKEESCHGEI